MYCYIEGDKEIVDELRRLSDGMFDKKVKAALNKGADTARDEAKRRAPVLTGALRDSLKAKSSKKKLEAYVFADYPKNGKRRKSDTKKQKAGQKDYYAFAVEYGTRHSPAQPFFNPAVDVATGKLDAEMEKMMKEAIPDDGPATA